METSIYLLIDPRTQQPKYVGATIQNIKKRLIAHFSHRAGQKRWQWISELKILGLAPSIELIESVDYNEWEFWERHYISLYRSWGFELVNTEYGGKSGTKLSEDTKQKIRIARANQIILKEAYAKRSITNKKIKAKYKPILQYNLNGSFVNRWDGTCVASQELNIKRGTITECLKGRNKTGAGFIWKYDKEVTHGG